MRSFTYDGAGNETSDTIGASVYNYRYNKRGRLDQLTIGSTVTASYTYDGLERMAIRTTQNMTPAGTTHYLYDRAGLLLAEADSTGQTLREYVWVEDMPLLIVSDVNTATPVFYFVHPDHLNRPLRMTNSSKTVVWNAVYLPFGGVVSINGPASNNLRFPGQYFLIENGLHYNWHRHYDPTLGRYIQPDPLGFVDGPSVYAYAASMPINRIDVAGLAPGDFPPPPPGYNSRTWKYDVTKSGRHRLVDPAGKQWICHPEDKGHWRHWDSDDGSWPPNNRKWNENQKRDYRTDQSRTDPSADEPPWIPPEINEFTPYTAWPRGVPGSFSPVPGRTPRLIPRFGIP